MNGALPRRLLSFGGIALLLPLQVVLSPIVLIVLAAVDAVTGRRDLPLPRLWIFAIVFVAHEWAVAVLGLWLWISGGFGRSLDLERHSRAQGAWIGSLLRSAGPLLGIRVRWPDHDEIPAGRVVVLSRHASMVDAVLPAHLFPSRLGRRVHYVLKRELRWLPSIDVFGHRLGNHFVARGGDTDAEVAAIARLGAEAEGDAAIVIFPEGTYATESTRRRVRASLVRREAHDLVAFADELSTLLPPKPAGTLALLDTAGADNVLVFGHVGMEGVAELAGLRRNLPARRPVEIRVWSHDASELPTSAESRTRWLQDRWRSLDAWVGTQRALPPAHGES